MNIENSNTIFEMEQIILRLSNSCGTPSESIISDLEKIIHLAEAELAIQKRAKLLNLQLVPPLPPPIRIQTPYGKTLNQQEIDFWRKNNDKN